MKEYIILKVGSERFQLSAKEKKKFLKVVDIISNDVLYYKSRSERVTAQKMSMNL